jgi:hypothetical protein
MHWRISRTGFWFEKRKQSDNYEYPGIDSFDIEMGLRELEVRIKCFGLKN